jgi:hypothetical protein
MRSYETGKYDIRSDGNLKSVLNVIEQLNYDCEITITVPLLDQLKNGQADIDWLLEQDHRISVELVNYHENAFQNRLKGIVYDPERPVSLVVTYFDVEPNSHMIFLCPGSPRPENTIYSETEAPWFAKQVENAVATFYFNRNQHRFGYGEKCFEITNVVKDARYDIDLAWAKSAISSPETFVEVDEAIRFVDIYFPYRLTDKDYNFGSWLKFAISKNLKIGVTDPNNSLDSISLSDEERSFVVKLRPDHHLFYIRFIDNTGSRTGMKIAWTSDLRKTLHMGPVEMWSVFRKKPGVFTFLEEQFTEKDMTEIFLEAERALIK